MEFNRKLLFGNETADRGARDVYFLAKVILGSVYPDISETTHKPICEFFVHKNPDRPFALQDTVKNRLLLAPRGHFKTSLDLVDCISWMLLFPNITILMLAGSQDTAIRMVEEVKQIFLQCRDFRDLYPEFIPKDNVREFGAKGEFWLPNRTRIRREPTLSISTLDSVKASTHYDMRIGDDVVTEINSRTNAIQKIDPNEKVNSDWNATKPLLNPGGYTQIIGTFYNFSCMYGKILDRLKLSDELQFGKPFFAERSGWKIKILPAIEIGDDGEMWNEKGIMFPEKFCITVNSDPEKFNLQETWDEDPENFNAQYMNHPKGTSQDYFPMKMMKDQTVPIEKVPMNSTLFAVWDLAFTENRKSDFTVGAVGAFDQQNNIYVVDLFRGRFGPYQIIEKIVEAWRKWPLQRQGVESMGGSSLLLPGLTARTRDLGLMIPIDWIQVKRKKDSVVNEILSLSTLLQQKKLWFVEKLPHLAELYVEFNRFGKYSHDDICRGVSMLQFYIGKSAIPDAPRDMQSVDIGGAAVVGMDSECGAGIVA